MRILFDQGTPAPLRRHLPGHHVETAYERGWSRLRNGVLLDSAEAAGFEVLVTTDTNLRFQQRLDARRIAIVVLSTTSWPRMQHATDLIARVVDAIRGPGVVEVTIS